LKKAFVVLLLSMLFPPIINASAVYVEWTVNTGERRHQVLPKLTMAQDFKEGCLVCTDWLIRNATPSEINEAHAIELKKVRQSLVDQGKSEQEIKQTLKDYKELIDQQDAN
jgi:hypothetical protein